MPRDDVILSPRTSSWSVRPTLDDTLRGLAPADPGASVLVAPVADGPAGDAAARAALAAARRRRRGAVLATHEPATKAGAVTTVPLPPGAHAVRRVLLVGVGDGSAAAWRTAGAAVGRATRGKGEVVHAVGGDGDRRRARGLRRGGRARLLGLAALDPRRCRGRLRAGGTAVVTGTADAAAVQRAVVRARAQLVARGLAATPSNTKNPAWLAGQAAHRRRPHRPARPRSGTSAGCAADGFGGILAVGQGSATPPRLVRLDYEPAGATAATPARRARRQGHHLRHRRPADQAGRRHGGDEDRHVRRRRRARGALGAAASSACRCGSPACSPSPRTPSAARPTAPATSSALRRAHHRDQQHRRRGPPGARRRARLRRRPARPRLRSSTSPRSPAPPASRSAAALAPVFATDAAPGRRARRRRRDDWRDAVADAPAGRLPRALDSDVADLNHIAAGGAAERSPRPCSSASSWASAAGRTSTSRAPGRRTSTPAAPPRERPGSGHDCCCGGWRRWHERRVRADGALVAGERPGGRRRPAARVRRRHLDRPVHVPRRPGLQGVADARGRVVRGHLRLRHRAGPHALPRGLRARRGQRPRQRRSSAPSPVLLEDWEVVAIAEGPAGFRRGAGPDVS